MVGLFPLTLMSGQLNVRGRCHRRRCTRGVYSTLVRGSRACSSRRFMHEPPCFHPTGRQPTLRWARSIDLKYSENDVRLSQWVHRRPLSVHTDDEWRSLYPDLAPASSLKTSYTHARALVNRSEIATNIAPASIACRDSRVRQRQNVRLDIDIAMCRLYFVAKFMTLKEMRGWSGGN